MPVANRLWRWVANAPSPWTNVYGVARTLLALGTAGTLAFNAPSVLFRPAAGVERFPICVDTTGWAAFCLGSERLEFVRWACVLALLVVASGWRPRYTALLHWWISLSLQATAITLDGGDQISAVLTLLLLPIALTDKRKWHWEQPPPLSGELSLGAAITRFGALSAYTALRFQVAIVYFHAAVGKLSVDDWINGTVMYYWFTEPTFGLPAWFSQLAAPLLLSPLVVCVTWATIVVELVLFAALFMPKQSWRYCLVLGLAFHGAIAVTMGLVSFGFAMSAALVLYLRPFECAFGLSSLSPRHWRRRPTKSSSLPEMRLPNPSLE